MLSQSMTLGADVGNGHNFPECSAGQRSNREHPGGGLPRRIDESAVVCGIQADAHRINPGKPVVEQVAQELEKLIGPNSYFYDRNDVSQLARPSQDILLQEFGNGGAIPASRLRGPFLVSRF